MCFYPHSPYFFNVKNSHFDLEEGKKNTEFLYRGILTHTHMGRTNKCHFNRDNVVSFLRFCPSRQSVGLE